MTIRPYAGKTPALHPDAFVDETALVIGAVTIGAGSSIWPMSVVRGDIQTITIGARSNIQDGAILHVTHDSEYSPGGASLLIGDAVTVGHATVLHGCTLEDECLVGMNTTVLDGAVVCRHAMVAAGSVVSPGKVLKGGFLYVGSPARPARALREKEIASLRYSAQHYVTLARCHRAAQNG